MNIHWLFRMKRWVQNPPSTKQVIFVGAIFAVCFTLFAIEYFIGWPDALSMDPRQMRRLP